MERRTPLQGNRPDKVNLIRTVTNNLGMETVRSLLQTYGTEEEWVGLRNTLQFLHTNRQAKHSGGPSAHNSLAPQQPQHQDVAASLDVSGAWEELKQAITMNDEMLAKAISEEEEERVRVASDEQLAKEMAEIERQQMERERLDTELARRLAEEEQDSNPPAEAVFAGSNIPPAVTLQEMALEDVKRDEEMARQLVAEVDSLENGRVAALINMFQDADPSYLTERLDGVDSEEEFLQVMEELLQCQKTEPRMKGHQKLLQQSQATQHDQEAVQAIALDPTTTAAPGQVFKCTICLEDNVSAENMASCDALYDSHKFCIDCIRKYLAERIGQGHSVFTCINTTCKAEFSWRTLMRVMEPAVYRKVQERRQHEEVMAAGLENLESCPFCCFMIIMPDPENKVFECLNPECLTDSCRLCKKPSHIPLRCKEVESDSQKESRKKVENMMAEAMIRQCPKCGKRYVTEGGCNKMQCSCGTVMCYHCKKVIKNGYKHFEERRFFNSGKCPLYTDSNELHTREVRQAAAEGKQQLEPGMELVHDPTRDVL